MAGANLALTLPVPTLAALGLESNVSPNASGTVNFVLPIPAISGSGGIGTVGNLALTLPTPGIAVAGKTPIFAFVSARLTLPVPNMALAGFTANLGALSLALPLPALSLAGPNSALLTLPVPAVQLVGNTGITGGFALTLPRATLDLEALVPFAGSLNLLQPVPRITFASLAGSTARLNTQLVALALALDGYTGVAGEIALTLPTFRLDQDGHGPFLGNLVLALPMLLLRETGLTSGATPQNLDGTVLPAITMHSETGALTQYTNFPFNSFAMFNGAYLAASAEGLFVLGGATDNGAIIQATARVGITDFGTSFLKRVDRSYVGYRTDGNLVIRVYTDEVTTRDYLLEATGRLGLHGNHFRIGKGLRARYWQFEVQNQNGADFTLNSIELKPTQLRRRIGGGDA